MRKKELVLATMRFFVLVFLAMFVGKQIHTKNLTDAPSTSWQPTFGDRKAPVQIVIFQEFRCSQCREFHESIFPYIKENYIDTGKAHCTFIPLAFLPRSKPLATAAMGVYEQNPNLFFSYIEMLYEYNRMISNTEDLLMIASSLPGISVEKLKEDIENQKHEIFLQKNFDQAQKIMGEQVATPALYINGSSVYPFTLETIIKILDQYE